VRLVCLIPAVIIVGISGPVAAQGWFGYVNEIDSFTVNFPAEPEVEQINYPSEYGADFPGRVYTARSGENVYSVTVIDYRDSENIHLARTNSTEADSPENYQYWIIDVMASIAYAAHSYRERDGDVTPAADHQRRSIPHLRRHLSTRTPPVYYRRDRAAERAAAGAFSAIYRFHRRRWRTDSIRLR
jgi:hypothetical protein